MPGTLAIDKITQGGGLNDGLRLLATSDGVRMDELWSRTLAPALEDYNALEDEVVRFFCHRSEERVASVTQSIGTAWQKKSQITGALNLIKVQTWTARTAFEEYQQTLGYTRDFLKKNSSRAITGALNTTLKALTAQKYAEVMKAIYTGTERDVIDVDTHEKLKIWSLANATGNMPIPDRGNVTFDPATHNHYKFIDTAGSGWTTLSNRTAAIKALVATVTEHGYDTGLVLIASGQMLADIQACPEYRPALASSDLISNEMNVIASQDKQANIRTFKPLGDHLRVVGTWDNCTVLDSTLVPLGYALCFAWHGYDNEENPVQFSDKGIETIGHNPFPYIQTELETGFGAGIRKRLNGAVLYGAGSASAYVTPTIVAATAVVGDWSGA